MMNLIKKELHSKCFEFTENRFQTVQNTIYEIQKALLSETKSSAGDKHETGRAMLQLEREKTGLQLAEIQKVKEAFSKIDISSASKNVCLGSVIYTNQVNYYIAVSAGELTVGNITFYAISPSTPIGQLLLSKIVGDSVKFRGKTINIEKIL